MIGPGLLVAATGVGAGDLATASFAGSFLGNGILWAAVLGAFLKYVVNEGLARWQLATGDTIIEGAVDKYGRIFGWLFLPYLLIWSFFVASALMSGSGVTLTAMFPVFDDPNEGRIVFGALASVAGITLVYIGGYSLFEKIMRVCIGVMFVAVVDESRSSTSGVRRMRNTNATRARKHHTFAFAKPACRRWPKR